MRQDLQVCREVDIQREQGDSREVHAGDGEGDRLPEDSSLVLLLYVLVFLAAGHRGSQLPDQGSNLPSLHWEAKSSSTGLPGSLRASFLFKAESYRIVCVDHVSLGYRSSGGIVVDVIPDSCPKCLYQFTFLLGMYESS